MTRPIEREVAQRAADSIQREVFGTRLGFVLAAIGSAVGLGNMWRFSYMASEGGGAAFVFLYILLTLLIGIPIMLAEFVVGRRGRLSPIGAVLAAGGKKWVPMGYLFVLSGFLILSYYSVIAGWTVRYALEALFSGFPADPGAHFIEVSTGGVAMAYHLAFMVATVSIVAVGIEKGIEKMAIFLMPALFTILVGLAFWAFTLEGSGAGYAFYLKPDFSAITPEIFGQAAAQAFFSLSLGMGAMLTFASYLSKHENLSREASVIALADFGVAFIAGLVVFPVIFALGLQGEVGASSLGALFISLPGAFESMGGAGRVVGFLFFVALVVGAITSAVSMLEVVVSSAIDGFDMPRKKAAIGLGVVIALIGLAPASSLNILGLMDAIVGEFLLVVGALGMAILVGWAMRNPSEELLDGASGAFAKAVPLVLFMLRFVVPPLLIWVIWNQGKAAFSTIQAAFGG